MDRSKNLQVNATDPGNRNYFNTSKNLQVNATNLGNQNTDCSNIINSFNTTLNSTCADEQLEIQKWLSSLEPGTRHEDVRNCRQEGLGNWFLQTQDFIRWSNFESDKATLFCSGSPGVGKTYLR